MPKEKVMSSTTRNGNGAASTTSAGGRSAVIDMLMDPSSAKGHIIPTPDQLNDELIVLLTAGNDTTSNSMIVGTYQICKHAEIYSKVNTELEEYFPSLNEDITYEKAKCLPYLASHTHRRIALHY